MKDETKLLKAAFGDKERIQQSLADLDRRLFDGSLPAYKVEQLKADYQQQMMAVVSELSSIKNSINFNLQDLKNTVNQNSTEVKELRARHDRGELSLGAYQKEEHKLQDKISALKRDIQMLQILVNAKSSGQLYISGASPSRRPIMISATTVAAVLLCVGIVIILKQQSPEVIVPDPAITSPPITAEGLNYLKNTSQIIGELTKGVSEGRMKSDSTLSLSATTGGRTDNMDICFIEGTQTGDGFRLSLAPQFQENGGLTMREIKGNVCITNKQSSPPLSALVLPADAGAGLFINRTGQYDFGIALADSRTGMSFAIINPPGGWIVVQGDQVTLLDRGKHVLTKFRFEGRNIEQEARDVMNGYVAPPDEQMIASAYTGRSGSVANSKIFSAFWDFTESHTGDGLNKEKQKMADFIISNTENYDCEKDKYGSYIFVSFQDHQDGIEHDVVAFQEKSPPSPKHPIARPIINYFKAYPNEIIDVESANLSWSVTGADTIIINPGTISVSASGTEEVYPKITTVYTLTAINQAGSTTAKATVKVITNPPPARHPDLTVTSVDFSPSSGMAGDTIDVTFTVENQGDLASGPFSIRISLATSPWGTDYSLGNLRMDSLNPGESQLVPATTAAIAPEIPEGSYWITVFVDAFQNINEYEEYNNIGSSDPAQFTVGTPEPPGPSPGAASVTIDSVNYKFIGKEWDCYLFDVEFSGTATAPVGFRMDSVLLGAAGRQFTGARGKFIDVPWAPDIDGMVIIREPDDPESITWTYYIQNVEIYERDFSSNENSVGLQINWLGFEGYASKQVVIPHP